MRLLFAALLCLGVSTVVVGCVNASCRPMDVNGAATGCSGHAGYVWTGTSCIYRQVCNCTGRDCESIYATQDSCENAHIHCVR